MIIEENLYHQICSLMPIPCVDLVVEDDQGRILLLKRSNEPAKGLWWFPGGRVHFSEMRLEAAKRILQQECGLEAAEIEEQKTVDLFLVMKSDKTISHAITTIYHMRIGHPMSLKLDDQHQFAKWRTRSSWKKIKIHEFIKKNMVNSIKKRVINDEK